MMETVYSIIVQYDAQSQRIKRLTVLLFVKVPSINSFKEMFPLSTTHIAHTLFLKLSLYSLKEFCNVVFRFTTKTGANRETNILHLFKTVSFVLPY